MSESAQPPQQELARLRAELTATQQQLAATQATLDGLSWTVSHDLRAHLRHITAYSGLLREELGAGLPVDAVSYLETVTQAARLMGRQIDGLMAWLQLGRAEMHPGPLDLPLLIEEARRSLATELADRAIDWRIADDLPTVRGDAVLVRQMLQQLLSNAIKFTRPRTRAVIEIGWHAPVTDGQCALFVRDNGVGFNPQQQDKLFQVFQRLHSASEFEGLGLGLAMAHRIVVRHGGAIDAAGEPDAGCCVRFTLPSGQ